MAQYYADRIYHKVLVEGLGPGSCRFNLWWTPFLISCWGCNAYRILQNFIHNSERPDWRKREVSFRRIQQINNWIL